MVDRVILKRDFEKRYKGAKNSISSEAFTFHQSPKYGSDATINFTDQQYPQINSQEQSQSDNKAELQGVLDKIHSIKAKNM